MKKILISFLLLIFSLNSLSQSEEFGLWLGTSFYMGDLNPGPSKHFYKNMNPALGILYKRNHRNLRYSYRLHFMYGKIEAYDFQSEDAWRQNRNLNFQSIVLELGALLEVNFVRYQVGNMKKHRQTPFLFFGLAGYNFKPKGLYSDSWYDLQALTTEGQETSLNTADKYKLNQIAIPIGIGYKVNLSENFSIALEYGARILFTDYLDDVSKKYVNPTTLANESGILSPILADKSVNQVGDRNIGHSRSNTELKDWYFFSGITLTYSFNKGDECTRAFSRK